MGPSVVLVGMMGAGKSTVGGLVARRLGLPFVDTDRLVADQTGRSVERLFVEEGEATFRALEAEALSRALGEGPVVVATGGGAVLSPENRALMRAAGLVVWLDARVATLAERTANDSARPLLDRLRPRESLARLQSEREVWYRLAADARVDSDGSPEAVADRVLDALDRAWPRRIDRVVVQLAEPPAVGRGAYEVHIGPGLLNRLGRLVADAWESRQEAAPSSVAVFASASTSRFFGEAVARAFSDLGVSCHRLCLPDGEAAKTPEVLFGVWRDLTGLGVDREALVVAVGGGALLDVAALAAGTFLRGLRLVHVPTTLLAQVDASVGGKAAINLAAGKNLVGVFHQPALVVADTSIAAGLPPDLFRQGLAEAVKHGLGLDADYFQWLEEAAPALSIRDPEAVQRLVHGSVRIKAAVVAADERERGARALLNLGHTFAHALEAAADFSRFSHGEAVAVGLAAAARLSVRLGLMKEREAGRVERLLERLGLPSRGPEADRERAATALHHDKKSKTGRPRFVLPLGIGRSVAGREVPDEEWRRALDECFAGPGG